MGREVMFFHIIDKVLDYYPEANIALLERAYVFFARNAKKALNKAESFMAHNLSVANILADMKLDEETIASGLIHDFTEKTSLSENEALRLISDNFSRRISQIVEGVSRLGRLTYTKGEEDGQAEYFRKMILAIAKDVRVILVRLADRLDEIRRLKDTAKDNAKREVIARETLNVYAPLAARLGIEWMKKELENISFSILNPAVYDEIVQRLAKTEEERNAYVEKVKAILRDVLAEHGIEARVLGRPKHIYSIYKKMLNQSIDINNIYDLIAFRIIVKTKAECYEVLSIIQSLWEQVPGRYKDFIERPKPNGYQSIHVTVIGPYGEPMEIQIRTEEMDKVANEGIAAHWLYKEGEKRSPSLENCKHEVTRYSLLRQLVEGGNNPERLNTVLKELVNLDLFPNEVYVFTPQGDIKVLPRGSTPVDFAYHIHTELGHRCIGARVNGKIVPLKHELQNGDVVEIITSKRQRPSKDWLSFVKTSKARSRIKQWLKAEEYERALSEGRELCEKEFRKKGLNFSEYLGSSKLLEVAKSFSMQSIDDLLVGVAFKKITPLQIIGRLLPETKDKKIPSETETLENVTTEAPLEISDIKSSKDILTRIARCCNPLPGEPIVGYITRGRGLTIHKKDCRNMKNAEPERLIEVEWETGRTKPFQTYVAPLKVIFSDKKGTLASINSILSQMDAEITEVHIKPLSDGTQEGLIKIAVKDLEHLKKIMLTLKSEQHVYSVERIMDFSKN